MTDYEILIEEAMKECMPWKAEIIRCAKRYIETNDAVRKSPCGWQSFHRDPKIYPEWAEYYKLSEEYHKASSNLWMATDVEYGDDDIANAAWEWRYWSVMARKCCWYQKSIFTDYMAGKTMSRLQDAETKLMEACGLLELYKPSSYYIERAFPKLKLEK
jgi:hypothetical protein